MASSGWQGEQTVYTLSANWRLVANIRIDSITHSGSDLRVVGTISVGGRGTNGYYAYFNDGIYARATTQGDGVIVPGGTTIYVGGVDYYRGFDVTISNVSEQTTSFSFSAVVRDGANQYFNTRLYWTLYFSASGTPPSGGNIEFVSHTWNSVTVTSSVSSWGSGYSNTPKLEGIFIDPVATSSNWNHTGRVVLRAYTNAKTMTFSDISNTNYSGAYDGGYTLKGMTPYKISCYASTELGETTDFDDTVRYTPPAPGQLSYTDEGNSSWRVVYTGVAANNSASYTAADLVRTFRYKDTTDANWTYVQQDAQAALTDVTISYIPISPQHTVEIEAWMTYKGEQSEVSATTITNAAPAVHLYGSVPGQVRNESAEIEKLYGSVSGQTKKITKLYASVGGVTKLIFEDNS